MRKSFATALLLLGVMGYRPAVPADLSVGFTKEEIALIRDYYLARGLPETGHNARGHHKGLPPGIAKQSLPEELVRVLPPVHSGYERVIIDGKVLLVEIATQVVRDVLYDVVAD